MSEIYTDYRNYSDEELIGCIHSGGYDHLMDYLLDKYKPMVRKKANALYLIGGDTEDLIQEGMIGLFKAIRDYRADKGCSFSTFAQLCINRQLNTVLEASRRKKNQPLNTAISFSVEVNENGELLENILMGREEDNPEQRVLDQEKVSEISRELVSRLSPMEQQVLRLYLQGQNYIQIAENLDKTPKSIDNCLQRIRSKLKQSLQV